MQVAGEDEGVVSEDVVVNEDEVTVHEDEHEVDTEDKVAVLLMEEEAGTGGEAGG